MTYLKSEMQDFASILLLSTVHLSLLSATTTRSLFLILSSTIPRISREIRLKSNLNEDEENEEEAGELSNGCSEAASPDDDNAEPASEIKGE